MAQRQKPGLLAKADLSHFGQQGAEIVHNLSTVWFVCHTGLLRQGGSTLPYVFLTPTDRLKERFGFHANILCVLHPYPAIDGRLLDAVDNLVSKNPNRLDKLCVLIVSNATEVDRDIGRLSQDNESRLFVPFKYRELLGGAGGKENLVVERIAKYVYARDLFAISSALKTDRHFFGRQREIHAIVAKYHLCENASTFGLRRIGKTSVLWAVVRELKREGAPVALIDCTDTRYHKVSWNLTLRRVRNAVFDYNGISESEGKPEEAYSERDASIAFASDMALVKQRFAKPCFIIFDEIENLSFELSPTDSWAKGDDYLFFWQTLRSLFQQSPNLFCFLLSGVNPKLIETPLLPSGKDNPLYRYIESNYLGFFDVTDVERMTSHIGQYLGLRFDPEIYTYLTDDLGGHPFLIRQACSALHRAIAEERKERPVQVRKEYYRAKRDQLTAAVRDYVALILQILIGRYPDEYQLLLNLAAGNQSVLSDLAHESDEWIRHLVGYGLVSEEGGKFHIRVDAVRRYIESESKRFQIPNSDEGRWAIISEERNRFEKRLRDFVRLQLKIGLGTNKAKDVLVKAMAKEDQKHRAAALGYDEIFKGETYLLDLKRAIEAEWSRFERVFSSDKARFSEYMETANKYRPDAHAMSIAIEDFDLVRGRLMWLNDCLDRFS